MTIAEFFQFFFWIDITVAIFIIILDNKPPAVSISWILFIIFVPFIGLASFILLGINWKKRKLTKQTPDTIFKERLQDILLNQKHFLARNMVQEYSEKENDKYKMMNLLLNSNTSIITLKNNYKLFHSGEDFFSSLMENLKNAKYSIHMEFYIWTSDLLGEKIKEILIEKALTGVEIRLLFDGVGSFGRISRKYRKQLKNAGIKFKYFLDLISPFSLIKLNYCNHRKIIVIDGKTVYTGGMNVGEEYITGGKRFKSWKDTQIKFTGESVALFQTIFLVDWSNSGDALLLDEKYFPEPETGLISKEEIPIQVVISGADSKWDSIHQMYFNMIANANQEIYIQTPYFIPDQSIMTALETAALSGISVNILMTGVPDKLIPFWAAHTYFRSLISAGVNIFLYKKGFMHSKIVIADGEMVSIGSGNLDIRSFHINFEINSLIYDSTVASEIIKNFYKLLEDSETVTSTYMKKIGILKRFRNSAMRMFSPIM